MSNDVSPLQSVQENIKAKIKAEFVNLIPDELWATMVNSVVKEFITDKDRSYNNHASPLKQLIHAELAAQATALLRGELEKLDAGMWDGYGGKVASGAIQKLIAEHLPLLVASVQKGMVDMAVSSAVNHMRNALITR